MTDHTALLGLSDEELLALAPEATHQHFKGGLYRLLGQPRRADTGGLLSVHGTAQIAYEHIHPHKREIWVRSMIEWSELVLWHDGERRARFRRLAP